MSEPSTAIATRPAPVTAWMLAERVRDVSPLFDPHAGALDAKPASCQAAALAMTFALAAIERRQRSGLGPDLGSSEPAFVALYTAAIGQSSGLGAENAVEVCRVLARLSAFDGVRGINETTLVQAAEQLLRPAATGSVIIRANALAGAYEALIVDQTSGMSRRGRKTEIGAFYTPDFLVEHLLDTTLTGSPRAAPTILDPTCGSGNFLVGAARRLQIDTQSKSRTSLEIAQNVYGVDSDAGAVATCRLALWLELGGGWDVYTCLTEHVQVADALFALGLAPNDSSAQLSMFDRMDRPDPLFPDVFDAAGGFDVVVGNPPFLNQLETQTTSSPAYAARLQERFGEAATGYADMASVFLVHAVQLARPDGGRVALVQPDSLLSARDALPARRRVLELASLTSFWIALEKVFNANVYTCAPTLTRGEARLTKLARFKGRRLEPLVALEVDMDQLAGAATWSPIISDALGVPSFKVMTQRTLGDFADSTAEFRDQFYGLAPFVRESRTGDSASTHFPLITSGLIDPLQSHWGRRGTRFNKSKYDAPVIDAEELRRGNPDLYQWAQSRLVPKLLLATQTRVLEVLADPTGLMLPSVPVISVLPREGELWRVAAALSSPVASAWAMQHYHGAALSLDAIKLSSSQVKGLPAPHDPIAWDEAAALAERISVGGGDPQLFREFAVVSSYAFGCKDETLIEWWLKRLPKERS